MWLGPLQIRTTEKVLGVIPLCMLRQSSGLFLVNLQVEGLLKVDLGDYMLDNLGWGSSLWAWRLSDCIIYT